MFHRFLGSELRVDCLHFHAISGMEITLEVATINLVSWLAKPA